MLDMLAITMLSLGVAIGVFGVLFGGSMFLSVPVFQVMFPGSASFGQIVGAIKVGSVTRGLFSSISTWRHINLVAMMAYWPVLVGSVLGAMTVSHLSQAAAIPILVLAILVSANPKKLARLIQGAPRLKWLIALAVGMYAGFFGAGISILIFALVRVSEGDAYTADNRIILANIQVRFLEFLTACVAVVGHIWAGSLTLSNSSMWMWWAVGMAMGGLIGGLLLNRFQTISGSAQRLLLFIAFAVALVTAFSIRPWN